VVGSVALGLVCLGWLALMLWHRRRGEERAIRIFGEPATEILARVEPPPPRTKGRHRIESREGVEMEQCENCGLDVLRVNLIGSENEIKVDSTPHEKGTVIVLGTRARFVDRPEDWETVRKLKLPVYRRHEIHCTGYWYGKVRHGKHAV
jgi:hypothetical protein